MGKRLEEAIEGDCLAVPLMVEGGGRSALALAARERSARGAETKGLAELGGRRCCAPTMATGEVVSEEALSSKAVSARVGGCEALRQGRDEVAAGRDERERRRGGRWRWER